MATSPPASPGRIFISYRREETGYPAGWLYDRLAERFGEGQVFKDVDSIAPGDDFIEVISTAVGSCDVLLALIGDRWLTITDEDGRHRLENPDDFVRLEIEAALARDVRVIPVLIDGTRMPRADELPPSLAGLVRRQALELSPNQFAFDTNRLLKVLDRTLTEVRAAQRGTPSIDTSDINPDTRTSQRPKALRKVLAVPNADRIASKQGSAPKQRRPSTRVWALAGLGLGVVIILLLIAAVTSTSPSTSPSTPSSTLRPPSRKAPKVAHLSDLMANFRRLGFTPSESQKSEKFSLNSLPSYYDETHRRYLRELGLRRAVASFFTNSASGLLLEVRIFEFRSPTQALKGRDQLSICFTLPAKSINTHRIPNSKGAECVVKQGPVQEVGFTKGARLYKLKLLGQSQVPSTKTIMNLALAEEAVA